MKETCPLCKEEADAVMNVTSGDSWADVAGLPPHSLFSKYNMLHVETTQFGDKKVYVHKQV